MKRSIILYATVVTSCSLSTCQGFAPLQPRKVLNGHHHRHQQQQQKLQILDLKLSQNCYPKVFVSRTKSYSTSTRLYNKKWGPRWNPTPDSEYYRRGNDFDSDYNRIHFSGNRKRNKFIPVFSKTGLFSLQRLLVVSIKYDNVLLEQVVSAFLITKILTLLLYKQTDC